MTKKAKNGTEQDDCSSTQNETEWDRMEGEWNDLLAKGPPSRTERKNFKIVGICPALVSGQNMMMIGNNRRVGRTFLWLKPIPGKSL